MVSGGPPHFTELQRQSAAIHHLSTTMMTERMNSRAGQLDDVPKKFINATNDFVKKFHWNTMMQMEEINGDNREDELDECQLETIRMSV